MEYNCTLRKVDRLVAYIALRVVAAYWPFPSGVGIKFAQSSSQLEERKADT